MSVPSAWPQVLNFFGRPLVIEPSPGQLSSDAGLLPVRPFDQCIDLTRAFAEALEDPRDSALTEHTFLEMVRARVHGILANYEDQNDHDTLRSDPVFKLLADRSPEDDDLASQPTLSRFQYAISIPSLKRLRDVFLDQFVASFDTLPRHLTFDLDAVDDPAHGQQQLTFWHGYYDQDQYLPLVLTCADNDQFVMLSLRPGNVHAALGADDDLAYLVARLRQAWPDVVLHFRGVRLRRARHVRGLRTFARLVHLQPQPRLRQLGMANGKTGKRGSPSGQPCPAGVVAANGCTSGVIYRT
jgi:hypothetical protein